MSRFRNSALWALTIIVLTGVAAFPVTMSKGGSRPAIDLEKYVAVDGGPWEDADLPPGPVVQTGSLVSFRFVVTSLFEVTDLTNIALADTDFDLSGCPIPDVLPGGASFECVIGPFACVNGQHEDLATVTADYWGGSVSDSDPAYYLGNCQEEQPGTGSPGYWKNHPEAWPVEEITIGGILYSKEEAIALMGTAGGGDKTYTMFRALVAAVLNVIIGNDPSCIEEVIALADAWMAEHPVGSDVRASSPAWQDNEWLYEEMDDYNNGLLCAPPREWLLH